MTGVLEPVAVSRATLKRLPVYHLWLKELAAKGREVVSCTHLAEALRLDPTQVRKDLAATGIVGRPRIGYSLPELLAAIETFLGWNNANDAVLVGVGNLGRALLGYGGFREHGLSIVAAFDRDPHCIGQTVHGVTVLDVARLPDLVRRLNIHLGIVTTPAKAAQGIADLLVAGGVQAIWNLTPTYLEVPDEVIVENTQLAASLAVLSNRLAANLKR